jgi:hypothetical protein
MSVRNAAFAAALRAAEAFSAPSPSLPDAVVPAGNASFFDDYVTRALKADVS